MVNAKQEYATPDEDIGWYDQLRDDIPIKYKNFKSLINLSLNLFSLSGLIEKIGMVLGFSHRTLERF